MEAGMEGNQLMEDMEGSQLMVGMEGNQLMEAIIDFKCLLCSSHRNKTKPGINRN